MAKSIYDSNFYIIPSIAVIKKRKEFYDLRRENGEQINTWLKRVKSHIKRCEFPFFPEYFLIDKFMCELLSHEKSLIQMGVESWSFKQFREYFGDRTVDDDDDTGNNNVNETIDEYIDPNNGLLLAGVVKSEPPVHTLKEI